MPAIVSMLAELRNFSSPLRQGKSANGSRRRTNPCRSALAPRVGRPPASPYSRASSRDREDGLFRHGQCIRKSLDRHGDTVICGLGYDVIGAVFTCLAIFRSSFIMIAVAPAFREVADRDAGNIRAIPGDYFAVAVLPDNKACTLLLSTPRCSPRSWEARRIKNRPGADLPSFPATRIFSRPHM